MKTCKNISPASLLLLGVIATVSNVAETAVQTAPEPDADSCWTYNVGAHATRGGSTGSSKQPCGGEKFCWIARKAKPQGQDLHATLDQFIAGCAGPNEEIMRHPGISKAKLPSCSEQKHGGHDLVCICNEDNCNAKDKIPEMKRQSSLLGGGQRSGSQNLGYSLFLTVSALMITIFFRA